MCAPGLVKGGVAYVSEPMEVDVAYVLVLMKGGVVCVCVSGLVKGVWPTCQNQ